MPKVPRPSQVAPQRHNPLQEDYSPSSPFKQKAPKKRKSRHDDETEGEVVVDNKASQRILRIGQELADEDQDERNARYITAPNPAFAFDSRLGLDEQDEDEQDGAGYDNEEGWGDEEEVMEVEETDPVDLETFDRFLPPAFDDPLLRTGLGGGGDGGGEEEASGGQTRNLADLILEKIAEKEAAQAGNGFEAAPGEEQAPEIPPRVLEVYTKIGHLLSRYKSGKLPKAFKIIPTLPPGMQQVVLELTQPQDWTPNAVYEATRIFISSNSSTAQYFVTSILLETVREDIRENKKLNIHLYNALKKALYKPAAFFQGLLFPMLAGGNCTLREATIVASAITRVSVPVDHSAIAISRCCDIAIEQMARDPDSAGPTNLCIKAFLEKKYALPYKTVDDLVEHFLRFRPQTTDHSGDMGMHQLDNHSKLPVIWHQCFLVFAQRYRDNISEEQRESLLDLLMVRGHSAIGPEIRRELLAGRGRGVLAQEPAGFADGGDTTLMAVDSSSGMVFG